MPPRVQALSKHIIHTKSNSFNPLSLFPLPSFATRWRLDWHWSLLDIIPISAKRSASALLEAFHHRPFGVIIGTREQILEELVQSTIAAHIGIIRVRFGLLRIENGLGYTIPVFTRLWKGRPGLCGRSRERRGRICKS